MDFSRRNFLLIGLGLVAYGCAEGTRQAALPGMDWPGVGSRPIPGGPGYSPQALHPAAVAPPAEIVQELPSDGVLGRVISRTQWAQAGPIASRLNPMNGINRITIHHEGMPEPVEFSDISRTRERLDMIRRAHIGRGFADIGYHFVIDRGGRIWQGRALAYQGAHVREHNEHNLGVMTLGNFDLQSPTDAQLNTLAGFVRELRRLYRVSPQNVKTHQEWVSTACPGRSLQAQVGVMRQRNAFV